MRSNKNPRTRKRLQKQRGNNRATRKYKRSQRQQRKNRNKKSQRGGYGSWSLSEIQSILPCRTVTHHDGNQTHQVSVPNFNSSADASSKICSETVDIYDAEQGAAEGVSVISGLQRFTPTGTTEVIAADSTGDGRTLRQADRLINQISHESEYQNLGRMVAPYPTRNATQQARFDELGQHATRRWDALVDAGYAGAGSAMPNPVATSPT